MTHFEEGSSSPGTTHETGAALVPTPRIRRRMAYPLHPAGAALILAVLLVAACGATTPAPAPSTTATPAILVTPSATLTSVPPSTSTALPNTATPLPPTMTVGPTTVTTPPPSAAASAPALATPGAVVYAADFATWFVGAESDPLPFRAGYDPSSGEYRLALTDAARGYVYYRYAPEGRGFADFQLDIDVRHVAGPTTGNFGVVFRAQAQGASDKTNARYAFVVYPSGHFALNLINADGTARAIAPYASTAALTTQGTTIHLTATCRGDRVTLSINGQAVGTYPALVTSPGAIGIVVGNPPNSTSPAGMEAAFSNLRVMSIPGTGTRHTTLARPVPAGRR